MDIEVAITVGDYQLSTFDKESFWLAHKDGEGMQITNIELENVLSQYLKDNF